MPNFPENKQMNNFLHIFFQHPLYLRKKGKKFFFRDKQKSWKKIIKWCNEWTDGYVAVGHPWC